MLFIWDPNKAQRNLIKHRVSFELAQTVFDDPLALSVLDAKHDNEERWVTIGQAADGQLLLVVHRYAELDRGVEMNRLISARKPTQKEVSAYEEGI